MSVAWLGHSSEFVGMTVHTDWLRRLLVRDLTSVGAELELFPDDQLLWTVPPGVSNSAGTLTLHICGNLQYFVGTVLGGTNYVRQRQLEFSLRDIPRQALSTEIATTIQVVEATLAGRDDARLLEPYPDVLGGLRLPGGLFLHHLSVHLGFHLGQMGYVRRFLTGRGTSSGAIDMHRLNDIA